MALTPKQRVILEAILYLIRQSDIPTVREVGALVGLRSSATVSKHLDALEADGWISRSGKSRGIRIADAVLLERLFSKDAAMMNSAAEGETSKSGKPKGGKLNAMSSTDPAIDAAIAARNGEADGSFEDGSPETERLIQTHFQRVGPSLRRALGGRDGGLLVPPGVSVLGKIAAGDPIEAPSDHFDPMATPDGSEPSIAVDPHMFGAGGGRIFALQIQGNSMIEAGILDGDFAIIRRQDRVEEGEIAAVLINGDATLKRWQFRSERLARSSEARASEARSSEARASEARAAGSRRGTSRDAERAARNEQRGGTTIGRRRAYDDDVDAALDFEGSDEDTSRERGTLRLLPENASYDPLEITEADRKEVIVVGKYVGLVRGVRLS